MRLKIPLVGDGLVKDHEEYVVRPVAAKSFCLWNHYPDMGLIDNGVEPVTGLGVRY
jgi:hypothetical protein